MPQFWEQGQSFKSCRYNVVPFMLRFKILTEYRQLLVMRLFPRPKSPGPPFYWPLARTAITHDSNEQSAEIPQNKIHPPKALAATLSAWKNISVRDSRIYPQTRNPLSSRLLLLSFSPLDKQNYKARTPLTESGGNPYIICIIWPDRGSGFLPSAITPRRIMRPAHVTQRQLKSLLFEPVNH